MDYGVFALEELRGIRDKRKGRVFNRVRSNLAYFQFRQFLTYKAENIGKQVILVDPIFSQMDFTLLLVREAKLLLLLHLKI